MLCAVGKGIARGFIDYMRNECEQNQKTILGKFMFTLPADHADIPFKINLSATDSEGNPIKDFDPDSVIVETNSTNPELVEIIMDEDEDPLTGKVRIGRPSNDEFDIASVEAMVTVDGNAIAVDGAQFLITVGDVDPNSIRARIEFEGITEDPQPPIE
jgi:hypothetical protein